MMRIQMEWLPEKLARYYTKKYDTQKWLTLFFLSAKGIIQASKTINIFSYVGVLLGGVFIIVNNTLLRQKDVLTHDEEKLNTVCDLSVFPVLQKGLTLIENGAVLGIIAETMRRLIVNIDFDDTDQTWQISSMVIAGLLSLRAALGMYEINSKKSLPKAEKLVLLSGPGLTLAEAGAIFSRLFLNLDYNTCNTINIVLAAANTIISFIAKCRYIRQIELENKRVDAQKRIEDLSISSPDLSNLNADYWVLPPSRHNSDSDEEEEEEEEEEKANQFIKDLVSKGKIIIFNQPDPSINNGAKTILNYPG